MYLRYNVQISHPGLLTPQALLLNERSDRSRFDHSRLCSRYIEYYRPASPRIATQTVSSDSITPFSAERFLPYYISHYRIDMAIEQLIFCVQLYLIGLHELLFPADRSHKKQWLLTTKIENTTQPHGRQNPRPLSPSLSLSRESLLL